ncbi:Glucan 1 [Phytophthora cinnamomi]|uniref:Glucan 1 n=1 Tax=Phytophthora cinnamomi TaxID=4785 RepID=UPI0035596DE4|nr:Glucan 1 [Phytophthora cinnamomi]
MVKVSKMLIDYSLRFGIPIALCYAYWDPKSDEEIRRDVESKIRPDLDTRKKKQAKFAELLLQKDGISSESKQQLDQVTAFTKTKEQYLADRNKDK